MPLYRRTSIHLFKGLGQYPCFCHLIGHNRNFTVIFLSLRALKHPFLLWLVHNSLERLIQGSRQIKLLLYKALMSWLVLWCRGHFWLTCFKLGRIRLPLFLVTLFYTESLFFPFQLVCQLVIFRMQSCLHYRKPLIWIWCYRRLRYAKFVTWSLI